ncbi:hypothetical protein [Nocardia nova]|uniref:hypothetical protein n=1 Tax=Nocardia nova TaxID=37330 RepID=UPI0033C508B8
MTSIENHSTLWTVTIQPLQEIDGKKLRKFRATVAAADEDQAIRRAKREAVHRARRNNDEHIDYCKYEDGDCITLSLDPGDYAAVQLSCTSTGHVASPFDSDALLAEFRSVMAEIPTLEGLDRERAFERATAAMTSLDRHLSRSGSYFPREWTRRR